MTILAKFWKRFDLIFFALLFTGILFLSFDVMYNDGKPTPPGVFYSDKSHYYVYLPATLIYGWDVQKFPHRIDTVYKGFILDYKKDKLVVKVTCGVAVLAAPFFLVTHGIALVSGLPADGFSDFYEKMALITPVFYLVLGLFFLKRFLEKYVKRYIALITILFILAGTNLYHYGLAEGWMSHVFSFFLFSLYLFLLKAFLDGGRKSYGRFLLIALVVSFAVLIRPTSILLIFWLILLDVRSFRESWDRVIFFLHPRYSIPFVIIGIIVFIPQFLYWHYLSGSYLFYSYPGESFLFWKDPMLLAVWFAPLNGLFLYTPLVFFMIAGIVLMIRKKIANGWFLALFFMLNSYLIASWHAWFFGGSFGCRPFVEYYALLALAFAYLLTNIFEKRNLFIRTSLLLIILLCVLFNLSLVYHYRWNTNSTWAWDDLRDYLDESNILHFEKNTYVYREDFENVSFDGSVSRTMVNCRSKTKACMVTNVFNFSCHYSHTLGHFLNRDVSRIRVRYWVDPFLRDSCGAMLVCIVENENHEFLLNKMFRVDKPWSKKGTWTEVTANISIPKWMNDSGYKFVCYLWNRRNTHFLVDDIEVRFE